jgi:hypothetical protein
MIKTFMFTLCFILIWLFTAVYPPLHKILRKQKTYYVFLIIAIALPIVTFFSLSKNYDNNSQKIFPTFFFLIFMLLYKYFDNYILKKYRRNLILSIKFNHFFWEDNESDKQTSTELLFQLLLLGVPLAFFLITI